MTRKRWWLAIILVAGIVPGIFICNAYFRENPTGWKYNGPANGGFEKIPYEDDGQNGGLILIEGAAFTMGKDSPGNSAIIIDSAEFSMGRVDSSGK